MNGLKPHLSFEYLQSQPSIFLSESQVPHRAYSVEKLQFGAETTNFFAIQADQLISAKERPNSTSGAAWRCHQVWSTILSDFRRPRGAAEKTRLSDFGVFQQYQPIVTNTTFAAICNDLGNPDFRCECEVARANSGKRPCTAVMQRRPAPGNATMASALIIFC